MSHRSLTLPELRRSMHRSSLAIVVFVAVAGAASPSRLHAQDPRLRALEKLTAMALDSVAGPATMYFRPADRERALELRSMLAAYLAYWHPRLGVDTRIRVAVLHPEEWEQLTPLPYAFATNFGPPANLIPAAAAPPPPTGLDTLLVVDGLDRRDWLLVGHEGGHLLTLALLPPAMRDSITAPPDSVSGALRERYQTVGSLPRWYWEYAANLFATGFLETTADSGVWTNFLRGLVAVPTPRFTHLDDLGQLMRAQAADGTPYFLSEGAGNFGWYQGVAGLLGAHVLGRAETEAIAQIRRLMSGEVLATTPEIVAELEAMAPGTRALLDSLGAGYGAQSEPTGADNAAVKLRALTLDSVGGTLTVHYSPGHEERARTLQARYIAAVEHYRVMFGDDPGQDLTESLALLDATQWSAFTRRPYGMPHIEFTGWPELIIVLPATHDRGAIADLLSARGRAPALEVESVADAIGFHEFGHAFNVRYLYSRARGTTALSLHWFDEFMATYFGQGYLWHAEGMASDPVRGELLAHVTPRYATVAEFEAHYPADFQSPEGYANYGWYQARFADRAREVFANQGLDFIRRVRDELPWDRYAEWRTDELLRWLEDIEPGFIAWAQSLARTSGHN